jgi:hypothetical protein
MQIWYETIPGYLHLEVLDGDGKPASGLSVDYSVRNSANDAELFSGVLVESNSVYSKPITITTKGEYKVIYTTPSGYEDAMEIISVKSYDDYKADVSALALEATAQDILTDTGSIVTTLSTLIANIWSYSTRTLSSFGSLIANIWLSATRTLTTGTRDSEIDLIKIETDKIPSLVLDSAKIETILQMETGKWKILNNVMIFYEDDNTTEICRFNLFDVDGNPTSTAATERRRV